MDANESVILENELDESPRAAKRKLEEEIEKVELKNAPLKKVILNRHTSIELSKGLTESKDKSVVNEKTAEVEDKKVIKLSSLSAKEVKQVIYFL